VLAASVWRRVLGVDPKTVITKVEMDQDADAVVVHVRQRRSARPRCAVCKSISPRYDHGEGRRRWRALDVGTVMAVFEADAPRVRCGTHGVVVAAVPWARHGSRFSSAFEDHCAWLTARAPASTVAGYLRTTWRSVTGIVERVVADLAGKVDQLDGLRRIGIDELAHRKGQRYVTCVVDHGTGRLVWAAEGRDKATLTRFFDELGEQRSAQLTHVSCDGAEWIHAVVRTRARKARICLDPFHVASWATKALDEVRRDLWRALRADGRHGEAASMKGSRWALLRSPRTQRPDQRAKVAEIAATNKPLYRAYLLKEQLLFAIARKGAKGRALVAGWLAWARRSRLRPFVKLAKTIEKLSAYLRNTMDTGLSNARSEATNTHLRVLTRRSYGFHSPGALIAMAMLTRGGLCPSLPGRAV
jgi:transposase